MKEITLSRGYKSLVDDQDYDAVMRHKWFAHIDRGGRISAVANIGGKSVYMHRFLLPHHKSIDHVNGIATDNRRVNLRPATCSENNRNNQGRKRKALSLKGIYYRKDRGKYQAQIGFNGRHINLGMFLTAEEAARCYDEAAIRLHGEFARTNYSIQEGLLKEAKSNMEVTT